MTATTEAKLCRILAEVLGLDLVRPQDGFFEVGGDSVRALQVVARAREAGLTLSVRDLFDHQTAQTLAAAIADLPAASSPTGETTSSELAFEDGEFGEFEDVQAPQSSGVDAGWETFT